MRLALFQPDMPGNAAATARLAACLDLPLLIIEPLGFVWQPRRLRRAGMDYLTHARITRFPSWPDFESWRATAGARLVLLTTRATMPHHHACYRAGDILLAGRESLGVPAEVHAAAGLAVRVPLAAGRRSLNVVTALAMVAGEALRQTDGFAQPGVPALD